MGSILDFETETGARRLRLYISGDTLVIDELKEIPKRFPEIDIGLFHLGGTRVTDAGLKELSGCKSLQTLNLSSTRVTDAGLASLDALGVHMATGVAGTLEYLGLRADD